jgi:aminodeoxychorismate lyase
MIVYLNGRFLPNDQAVISVFDRSFLYGDGLFETLRVFNGRPFRWEQHMERLRAGTEFLKIPIQLDDLQPAAEQLIAVNTLPDALLRVAVSRGVGVRGYSPRGADSPTIVMSLNSAPVVDPRNPPIWNLITSSFRLPANQPLAYFKTCNKLLQVLARSEADAQDAHETLLLNSDGFVSEGASSNMFWIQHNRVCTPPLVSGILPGVTRAVTAELCKHLGLQFKEPNILPEDLPHAEGVFLTLSSFGVVEAGTLNGRALPRSPLVATLRDAYHELINAECPAVAQPFTEPRLDKISWPPPSRS